MSEQDMRDQVRVERGVTAKEVWETLSALDVNEFTETLDKGKYSLTYLSWTWAYTQMVENYPQFEYAFGENEVHADSSVTVHVNCWIDSIHRTMWLPVMNHKNTSVSNPTSREISDAKMRCLVKCISMFGLGLYIYSGEDVPREPSGDAAKTGKVAAKGKLGLTDAEQEKFDKIEMVMTASIEEETDKDDLRAFWKKNGKELKATEAKAPEIFARILEKFKAKGAEIDEKNKEKEE